MFFIGPHAINSPVLLAPMAGITDLPFRQICQRYGAGLATSEMVTSDTKLWKSNKSRQRLRCNEDVDEKNDTNHGQVNTPVSVQIAGNDPKMMAEAARQCVDIGAQIIDINMGCPAKKVCKKLAGSALLKDEALVADILHAVVSSVSVPVTLKTRTGWAPDNKNGLRVAKLAEDLGIQAIAIHGRTRACRFEGHAEYDVIADIAGHLSIPVIANGDIDSGEKAQQVLKHTGASAVMVGRAAFGNPWLFAQIQHYLATGNTLEKPEARERIQVIKEHLTALYHFYGEYTGLRIARKHFAWYCKNMRVAGDYIKQFNKLDTTELQIQAVLKLDEQCDHYEEKAA